MLLPRARFVYTGSNIPAATPSLTRSAASMLATQVGYFLQSPYQVDYFGKLRQPLVNIQAVVPALAKP